MYVARYFSSKIFIEIFIGDSIHTKWVHFQQISPIDGIIKIGESLTVLIYLKDNERKYDILVRDCYAFSDEDYDNPETTKLRLTDSNGCPR